VFHLELERFLHQKSPQMILHIQQRLTFGVLESHSIEWYILNLHHEQQ
jgi:hypothetical protein